MAEKEKKKGGKLKKLIIALVAISIVVGIVLAIVLSSPKGNKGIIRSLDNVSSISMIDNEESKAEYEAFTQKLSSDANTSHYAVEVLYTSSLSSAVNYVIDYYNDYYIFAKGNKVRKKQDNNIRKALKEIKSLEKQLNKILAESKNIDSSIHMQNKWIAYRKAYAKQFDAYAKLFKALNKVYHGSLGNTVVVNQASKNIMNAVDDYMAVLGEKFDILIDVDVEGNKQSNYNYEMKNYIYCFKSFAEKYFTNSNDIKKYSFSEAIEERVNKVSRFASVYGEENYQVLIESIGMLGGTYMVRYEKEGVEDNEDVLVASKNFILGGA